jgi:hypothetical protein
MLPMLPIFRATINARIRRHRSSFGATSPPSPRPWRDGEEQVNMAQVNGGLRVTLFSVLQFNSGYFSVIQGMSPLKTIRISSLVIFP